MTPEFDKEHYKQLKRDAKLHNVYTTILDLSDTEWRPIYNGITVAFSPATELDDNRMLEVSVSYCAPEDAFRKKIGKYHALRKFFEENNYIHLPLGRYLRDNGVDDTAQVLLDMFSV
jgi:hypothetical protein